MCIRDRFPTEYLVGGAGDDTLGGTGVNKHYGGAGNDTYTVDQTGDVVIELNRTGGDAGGWDTVIAKCDYTLPGYVEKLRLANDTGRAYSVSYTHLRAHETVLDLVCRLLLEKKPYTTNTEHYGRN